ncbi:hypothetical protein NL676_022909 [Syzygium grande]|nr:hypothetical protein NL676_022909 [Syzygium grande]
MVGHKKDFCPEMVADTKSPFEVFDLDKLNKDFGGEAQMRNKRSSFLLRKTSREVKRERGSRPCKGRTRQEALLAKFRWQIDLQMLTLKCNIENLKIGTDTSTNLIKCWHDVSPANPLIWSILMECRTLAESFNGYRIRHVLGEAKLCADRPASKHGKETAGTAFCLR